MIIVTIDKASVTLLSFLTKLNNKHPVWNWSRRYYNKKKTYSDSNCRKRYYKCHYYLLHSRLPFRLIQLSHIHSYEFILINWFNPIINHYLIFFQKYFKWYIITWKIFEIKVGFTQIPKSPGLYKIHSQSLMH